MPPICSSVDAHTKRSGQPIRRSLSSRLLRSVKCPRGHQKAETKWATLYTCQVVHSVLPSVVCQVLLIWVFRAKNFKHFCCFGVALLYSAVLLSRNRVARNKVTCVYFVCVRFPLSFVFADPKSNRNAWKILTSVLTSQKRG